MYSTCRSRSSFMHRNSYMLARPSGQSQRLGSPTEPEEAADPDRPTGQTALSAARNVRTSEPP
eukprot:9756252-Alexandrium_andersonii.AAC.1